MFSLGGGLAASVALGGALAGCSTPTDEPTYSAAVTARRLVEATPFYIAHRGGGRAWPELTAYAYEQASALPGLQALEMSVCRSRDGVLVLSHDSTTTRMTGVDLVIAKTDWVDLAKLKVTAAETLDPHQEARPFARLDDVLDRYIDRFVIFIEPKVESAGDPLFTRMEQLRQSERVVWKQPINSERFARAQEAGFMTWGYVLDEPAHTGANLQRLAADESIEMIGAQEDGPKALIEAVSKAAADNAKRAIMWPISTATQRDFALKQGYQGIMCSDPRTVMQTAIHT